MISVEPHPSHISGLTMYKKSDHDCILADLHSSEENADDDILFIALEPFSDPASPANFGNPEQVSFYAIKQSKLANHPADICHILPNQMQPSASIILKPSDENVVSRKTPCQVHVHTHSVSTPKSSSVQFSISCGANRGVGQSAVPCS